MKHRPHKKSENYKYFRSLLQSSYPKPKKVLKITSYKTYCFNCRKFVSTERDTSAFVIIFLILAFGWLFGLGILFAVLYYHYCPKICAFCKGNTVWEDNPKNYAKTTTICKNYSALESGRCSLCDQNYCGEIRSLESLEILNKRGFFCPHQDEVRERFKNEEERQVRWVKTFEKKIAEEESKSLKRVCPFCKALINRESKFCVFCGSKM